MSIAAKQLREELERKFPGIRISRYACRDTAGGSISQHSAKAKGEYDSNALDIMGGPKGWTYSENVALIHKVVDFVQPLRDEYSVHGILWQVPDHYGHAHIDFWPMCAVHQWCGLTPTTLWRKSNGDTFYTSIPEPENGRYEGDDMAFPTWWVEGLAEAKTGTRARFVRLFGEQGKPAASQTETNYWMAKLDDPNDPEWPGFYARRELEFWAQSSDKE